MTATQVIWLFFIGMIVNFAGMRYFWLRSEEAEKENKQLKRDIERKDRLLARWERGEITRNKEADHEPTDRT